jgi:hypothetical protein
MGLLSGKVQIANQQTAPNELNPQELEILLGLLKDATFKGEHVEIVYNTIIKLQNQYIDKTKK